MPAAARRAAPLTAPPAPRWGAPAQSVIAESASALRTSDGGSEVHNRLTRLHPLTNATHVKRTTSRDRSQPRTATPSGARRQPALLAAAPMICLTVPVRFRVRRARCGPDGHAARDCRGRTHPPKRRALRAASRSSAIVDQLPVPRKLRHPALASTYSCARAPAGRSGAQRLGSRGRRTRSPPARQ
jgi:hypothetical protein